MGRLGGTMAGEAMVEGARPECGENCRRGSDNIAIEDHRYAGDASGENGADDGGELSTAQPAQHLQRIGEMIAMDDKAAAHRLGLARETGGVDAGAGPDPIFGVAAMQGA